MLKILATLSLIVTSSLAWAGGVSGGGGGGTTEPEPIEASSIVSFVEDGAEMLLRVWLQTREVRYFDQRGLDSDLERDVLKIFFESEQNIFSVLDLTTVHLKMKESCYDTSGLPSDGSVNPELPNQICLSPFLMAPKLNRYNGSKETLGLLVHELAHLMGADEQQAYRLQKMALQDFFGRDLRQMDDEVATSIWDSEDLLSRIFEELQTLIDNKRIPLQAELRKIERRLYDLDKLLARDRGLNADEYLRNYWKASLYVQDHRIGSMLDFACVADLSIPAEGRAYCKQTVERVFGQQDQLSMREYYKRWDGETDLGPVYDSFLIRRLDGFDDFRSDLETIKKGLQDIQNSYSDLLTKSLKTQVE
jgi:hypothetical protein